MNEISTPIQTSISSHVADGVLLKDSKSWMTLLTTINTNASESRIHEILYFVSFMNLRAIDAAMICSTIEIIRAISLTMAARDYFTKIEVIY
jgi:hypothetical protein